MGGGGSYRSCFSFEYFKIQFRGNREGNDRERKGNRQEETRRKQEGLAVHRRIVYFCLRSLFGSSIAFPSNVRSRTQRCDPLPTQFRHGAHPSQYRHGADLVPTASQPGRNQVGSWWETFCIKKRVRTWWGTAWEPRRSWDRPGWELGPCHRFANWRAMARPPDDVPCLLMF